MSKILSVHRPSLVSSVEPFSVVSLFSLSSLRAYGAGNCLLRGRLKGLSLSLYEEFVLQNIHLYGALNCMDRRTSFDVTLIKYDVLFQFWGLACQIKVKYRICNHFLSVSVAQFNAILDPGIFRLTEMHSNIMNTNC